MALAALLVTLLITTLMVVVGRHLRRDSAVPPALVGVWGTANAQYADRFFEITPASIFFGLGDGQVEAQPIVGVDQVRDEHGVIFTISYRNQDGQEFRFSFYYDPRDAGVIRFTHQRNIQWTKARP